MTKSDCGKLLKGKELRTQDSASRDPGPPRSSATDDTQGCVDFLILAPTPAGSRLAHQTSPPALFAPMGQRNQSGKISVRWRGQRTCKAGWSLREGTSVQSPGSMTPVLPKLKPQEVLPECGVKGARPQRRGLLGFPFPPCPPQTLQHFPPSPQACRRVTSVKGHPEQTVVEAKVNTWCRLWCTGSRPVWTGV